MKYVSKILVFALTFILSATPVFAQNTYDNLDIKKLPEFQYKNIDKIIAHTGEDMNYVFKFIDAVKGNRWDDVNKILSQMPTDMFIEAFPGCYFSPAILGAFSDNDLKRIFERLKQYELNTPYNHRDELIYDQIPKDEKDRYKRLKFFIFEEGYPFINKLLYPTDWFLRTSFYRDTLASMSTYSGHYFPYVDINRNLKHYGNIKLVLNDIKDLKLPDNWKMDIARRYSIMRFYKLYKEVNPELPTIKFFENKFKLTPVTIGGYKSGFNPNKQKYLNFYCNAIYSSDNYFDTDKNIIANIYDTKNKLIAKLKPDVSYIGDYMASYTFTINKKNIHNVKYLKNGKYTIKIQFTISRGKKILKTASQISHFIISRNKPNGTYTSMPTYFLDLPMYLSYNYMEHHYNKPLNKLSNSSIKKYIKHCTEDWRTTNLYGIQIKNLTFDKSKRNIEKYYNMKPIFGYVNLGNSAYQMTKNRAILMNRMYEKFINTKIQLMTDTVLFDKNKQDWMLEFHKSKYYKKDKIRNFIYLRNLCNEKLAIMALGIDYQRYNYFYPKYPTLPKYPSY